LNDPAGRLLRFYADLDLDHAGQLPKKFNHGRIEIVNPGLRRRDIFGDRLRRFNFLLGDQFLQLGDAVLGVGR
jgi:hypothetical protein